jgi:hypothetical protein
MGISLYPKKSYWELDLQPNLKDCIAQERYDQGTAINPIPSLPIHPLKEGHQKEEGA